MSNTETANAGRAPLKGVHWNLSTPNTVAVIGLATIGLLVAIRAGFRPVNLR